MTNQTINAKCRCEEVPVIGNFALTSAERDQAYIVTLVPDYTTAFFAAIRARQEAVENLVLPMKMTAERKKLVARLHANMDEVNQKLTQFEIQLSRAKDLTVAPESFMLSDLRKSIHAHNTEGVLNCLKYTMGLMDDNFEALKQKGMTEAQKAFFATMHEQIKVDNTLQSAKVSDRRSLTQDNIIAINAYWAEIMEVMKTCRLVYKRNPAKMQDYTFTALRRLVRNDHKKAKETLPPSTETTGSVSASVTSKATGEALDGVTMLIINTTLADVTDAGGDAFIDEVPVGKCTLSFSKPGFVTLVRKDIEVKPGDDTELEVEMEPETI